MKPALLVPALLLPALLSLPARADEVTLYAYPTYFGLDWEAPGPLARSALFNSIPDLVTGNGTSIGHVTVDVDCAAGPKEPARRVVTGMTQSDLDESPRLLFRRGYALGILFHDFAGKLETRERVEKRLAEHAAKGRAAFVTFRIAPKACRRLVRYFDEYEAAGYGAHYGLPHRPLHREGSGCSAFGASFLETAGLLTPELKSAWSRTVAVPMRWTGGPLTGDKVSLWRLLFSRGTRWAEGGEPSKSVFFYDPDKIHAWIRGKVAAREPGLEVRTVGRSSGIVLDATKTPVPAGPIWAKP